MFLLFIRLSCTTLVIYILTDLDDCHRLIAGCGGGVTTCASNWKFLFSHTHTHACACIAFLTVVSVSYHFLKGTDTICSE